MITVKLMGGMGNQMFQYAAGRAMALRLNTPLTLDISWFHNPTQLDSNRHYELHNFSIQAPLLKKNPYSYLPFNQNNRMLKRLKQHMARLFPTYLLEQQFHYSEQLTDYDTPDAYLEGYWQSYKYFDAYSRQIHEDLTFKNPMNDINRKIYELISTTQSISIHVRRGDYISNKNAHSYHGTSPLEYYQSAIDFISCRVDHPVFFIFSDDIPWVEENLHIPFQHYFIRDNLGSQAYEDMRLMTACSHNILANSTFSWWGAWLNSNLDKIVIAPKKWFNNSSINTSDLIPTSWIRL